MKILVTGADGQVGSRVVRQLLEKNYEVKGLILPETVNRRRIEDLGIEIAEGNLLDAAICQQAIEDVDAIIHTANLVGPLPGMSETEFFNNNVISTFNMVSTASKRSDALHRFVHISSSGVYPNDAQTIATEYNPVDEKHPLRPEGVYPISKLVGEEIVGGYTRQTGLRSAILRPSGICSGKAILGRWSVAFVCNILRAGQNSPRSSLYMADGTELWHDLEAAAESRDQPCAVRSTSGEPWIYQLVDARDVAHGCVCALENDSQPGDAFNISAPEPITFDEAAEVISEATGLPILEWEVPVRWVFDLSNQKARREINYQPKWGIKEMVKSALATEEV
jgi:nucleoside-diphosphate-sugar epimerase